MIQFFDLAAQQLVLKNKIDERIQKVLSHGKYILGPEVAELEESLVDYTGAKYCVTCANGTDALQIALMALDIGPGDEVITPSFSYIATAEATALIGAKPIYVDVDYKTCNVQSSVIEEKLVAEQKLLFLFHFMANLLILMKLTRLRKSIHCQSLRMQLKVLVLIIRGKSLVTFQPSAAHLSFLQNLWVVTVMVEHFLPLMKIWLKKLDR